MEKNLDTPLFNERPLGFWHSEIFDPVRNDVVEKIMEIRNEMQTKEPNKKITVLDAILKFNSLKNIDLPVFEESGEEIEEIAEEIKKSISKPKPIKNVGKKTTVPFAKPETSTGFLFDNSPSQISPKKIKGNH